MNIPPPNSKEGSRATPGDSPRPSPQSTAQRGHSSSTQGGWEQSNDIRGDLASGWGGNMGGGGNLGNRDAAAAASERSRAGGSNNGNNNNMAGDWGWRLRSKAVHPVPPFYPMDPRSTRRITLASDNQGEGEGEDEEEMKMEVDSTAVRLLSIDQISNNISTACQSLSIHGIWDNNSPSARLSSMERVEMEITIYSATGAAAAAAPSPQQPHPQVLLVELQRRKGCSVIFHNYRRCLLDAAEGKFDLGSFNKKDGLDKPLGRDRTNQPRATLGRPGLARPSLSRGFSGGTGRPSLARPTLSPPGSPMERPSGIARPSPFRPAAMGPPSSPMPRPGLRSPSFSADDASMPIAGLKTEGESPLTTEGKSPLMTEADVHNDILDKALKALNMAASLIKKDRVDARRLGMESLVLLTDPLRAGMETAKIASRVVLLGSANENDAGLGDNEDDVDALFDESAGLGIRETILEMIMADDEAGEKMGSGDDFLQGIEKEFTDSLFNLCLTVLSNALHTIEESVKMAGGGPAPSRHVPAPSINHVERDGVEGDDRKPSPGNSPNRRRAATEPSMRPTGLSRQFIDDTNSAFGCDVLSSLIRILGQAKTNPHDAYHSARCLGVLFKGCGNSHKARARRDLDAKRIIAAALEVGSRSHAKLEDASRVAMMALVTDDEESVEEEGAGENTEMENQTLEGETEEGEQQQRPGLSSLLEQSMSADSDERL